MGVKDITKKIQMEADDKAKSILDGAEQEAESILEKAEADAEKRRQEILQDGKRSAEQERQRILADAKLQAKKMKWAAREEIINEAMEDAKTRIKETRKKGSYDGRDYKDILLSLIKDAVSSAGGSEMIVKVGKEDTSYISQEDLDELSDEMDASLTFSDEHVGGLGGVVVRTSDGEIEVNNTFDKRFERLGKDIRANVATVLFGGG